MLPTTAPSSATSACASWAAGRARTCPFQWAGPRPLLGRRTQPMWAWPRAVNQITAIPRIYTYWLL